jgi:collagen type IV alpha-3-binding protein
MSIQSNTLSTASGNSLKQTSRNLREKLHEIETYRDILNDQIDALQKFFNVCATQNGFQTHFEAECGLKMMDFKGENITFQTTTSAVITTLNHCIEIISQKEDNFKKKFEKEVEKRKKVEDELK